MPTAYQRLMDRAAAFLDAADVNPAVPPTDGTVGQAANGVVQFSVAPGIDVAANVGEFKEGRDLTQVGFQRFEFGTILVRLSALAAANVTARPAAGSNVTVLSSGTTYRIEFCGADSTGYTLSCKNIY